MPSDKIVLLFDIIILILGVDAIISAMRMKKTGIPSAILIPKEEQPRIKNTREFSRKMYQPTILFGIMICLYGMVDICNRYMLKLPFVNLLSMACFLVVCVWYLRKLREVKGEHMQRF